MQSSDQSLKPSLAQGNRNRFHLWHRFPEWLFAALLGIATLGYFLPWLANPAAGLSANGYDLAEWVGLRPAVRYAEAWPMLAPFLLRLPLAGIAILFALRGRSVRNILTRTIYNFCATLLAITLAPPLDFFRKILSGEWSDVNHRQQFLLTLTVIVLLLMIFALRKQPINWKLVGLVISAGVIASSVVGQKLSLDNIQGLGIAAPVGIGSIVLVVSLGIYVVCETFARRF